MKRNSRKDFPGDEDSKKSLKSGEIYLEPRVAKQVVGLQLLRRHRGQPRLDEGPLLQNLPTVDKEVQVDQNTLEGVLVPGSDSSSETLSIESEDPVLLREMECTTQEHLTLKLSTKWSKIPFPQTMFGPQEKPAWRPLLVFVDHGRH